MPKIVLDKEAFVRRIKRLYSEWKNPDIPHDDSFSKIDCFMVAVGANNGFLYSKSTALQQWLIGYELTDTISVFTEDAIHFLSSKKNIELLKQLENYKEENVPAINFIVRDRIDKDKENFKHLLTVMKEAKAGKTIGIFAKESFSGKFCESWKAALNNGNFEKVDVSTCLAYIMSAKEESEIVTIKKACLVSVDVFQKYLKDAIMEIVDADKKVTHAELAEGVEKALKQSVDSNILDVCYPVILQSGGNYCLKFGEISDNNSVHFGAIVCSLGIRYKSYCSNISRTLLANPSGEIQENYNFLLSLQEKILKLLVPGKKLNNIYEDGLTFAKKEAPNLVKSLTKLFGFAMGIEFRESSILIGPKCTAIVKKGMVFNVYVGLSNLKNDKTTDSEGKSYALFVGDTVLVCEDGSVELSKLDKSVPTITINFRPAYIIKTFGLQRAIEIEKALKMIIKSEDDPVIMLNIFEDKFEQFVQQLIVYMNASNNTPFIPDLQSLVVIDADAVLKALIKELSDGVIFKRIPPNTYIFGCNGPQYSDLIGKINSFSNDVCIQAALIAQPDRIGAIGGSTSDLWQSFFPIRPWLRPHEINPFEDFNQM